MVPGGIGCHGSAGGGRRMQSSKLRSLPHTTILPQAAPCYRFSAATGDTQVGGPPPGSLLRHDHSERGGARGKGFLAYARNDDERGRSVDIPGARVCTGPPPLESFTRSQGHPSPSHESFTRGQGHPSGPPTGPPANTTMQLSSPRGHGHP